ncbi:MAG: hypothetical protein ACTHKQ_19655 [Mesorhizobium sp.]
MGRSVSVIKYALPVLARIEDAQEGNSIVVHRECQRQRALEPDDAQAGPDVIPACSTLGRQIERKAVDLLPLDERQGSGRRRRCDPVINAQKIVARFRREDDRAPLHDLSFNRDV